MLPTSRDFVTQLLDSLPSLPHHNAESNPLSDAPESVKKQLLSLQVLFPNEFLPALDLLDRRLVTRFLISSVETTPSANEDAAAQKVVDTVHYVRSAQQRPSRYSTSYDGITSYEVRLQAWNCTCPVFAFAAFPSVHPEPVMPAYGGQNMGNHQSKAAVAEVAEWTFGGMSLCEGLPPVCKHLLACVLVTRCKGVFGGYVEEKSVSVETAAGWAAGWGD